MGLIFELWDSIGFNDLFIRVGVFIIFSLVLSCTDIYIFTNLFRVQSSKSKTFKVFLLDSSINFLCSIFFPVPYYRIINMIIDVFLFKIFFKQSIEKCVLGGVCNFITIISLEVIFAKIFSQIFNMNYNDGILNYKYFSCVILSILLFRLLLAQYIRMSKYTLKLTDHLNKGNKIGIIFICIVSSIFMFFSVNRILNNTLEINNSVFVLEMLLLILYFYININNIERISKLDELELKMENLEKYNKTLSEMYDSVKIIKHNFSNFIQALDGYAQVNDIEGIRTMCASICKECNNVTNMERLNPRVINNPAIYSIIANKYYIARENNITMNVDIMFSLKEIEEYIYDLSSIIGILLDNAIEASKKSKEKIINIKFVKDYRNNNKLIIIENSFVEKEIDVSKIFEKGYSTKIKDKSSHGLGLWHVKKLISNYNNLNIITSKEKLFCQRIEIYSSNSDLITIG